MKKLSLAVFLFLFSVSLNAQEIDEAYSGANDTENKILDIMKEVKRKYELTDNILSEGEVKIKAPGGVDESASIEIRAKKKNDSTLANDCATLCKTKYSCQISGEKGCFSKNE